MREININIEGYNVNGICVGCLNYNRKMYYCEQIKECLKLLGNIDVPDGLQVQVCWECLASVQAALRFRNLIISSYEVLIDYSRQHTFLNSPSDLSAHARQRLSVTSIESSAVQATIGTEDSSYIEVDVSVVKEETKEELEESEVVKSETEYVDNTAFPPDDRASSEDDLQLSTLKKKKERRTKKVKKKKREERHKIKSIKTDIKTEKVQQRNFRKLKNLPPDLVELYTMSEDEMWQIRQEDVSSAEFCALKYKCSDCIIGFNSEKLMNDHMQGKHVPVMESTSKRQKWDKDSMAMAILAIRNKKMGFLKASKVFGVPKTTLIRLSKKNDNISLEEVIHFKLGRKATLTAELEADLAKYVLEMEASGFGLTRKDIKCLAYQLAEKNNLNHSFSKENESAGKTWLRLFLRRHPELSFCQPTGTSIARLKGFNKENVSAFYTLLEDAMDKYKYTANNIYNVDETDISVVPSKLPEVLAKKGKKQVAATTSAERRSTVTCVMCMSASGSFVPPMMIFPRKRDHPLLMKGAPPGAIHACHPSGWIQTELFTKWFKHFIQYVKPSEASPVLLVLDGQASHTRNIELIDIARENHVQLLSLPPHSSHKIQPLDRTFMGPLKKFLTEEIRQWMRNNTRAATHYDIAGLFGRAYIKSQRAELAINGFRVTGICPLDRNVFQDHDFIDDSLATDMNLPTSSHIQQAHVINTSQSQTQSIVNEPESTDNGFHATVEGTIHEAAQHSSNPVEPSITIEYRPIAIIQSQQQSTILAKPIVQCQLLSESESRCQIEASLESTDESQPTVVNESHIQSEAVDSINEPQPTANQDLHHDKATVRIIPINQVPTLAQLALVVTIFEQNSSSPAKDISNKEENSQDTDPSKETYNAKNLPAGPSTSTPYLSPRRLYPVPILNKKTSNRGRKATKPTLLTSSPYKLELQTSIKKKEETELLKKKRNVTKELEVQKKAVKPKKKTESKKKLKGGTHKEPKNKTQENKKSPGINPSTSKKINNTESALKEIPLLQNYKGKSKKEEGTKQKTAPKRKSKNNQITSKQTAQKKRKTTKKVLLSSSDDDNYSVNDDTDESPDRSETENGKCLYCDGLFSEDVRGEQWIQCPCQRWAHEECAGVDGVSFLCEYCK